MENLENVENMENQHTPVQTANVRRYLVCVDERPECRVALRMACMKEASRGGAITLLHVVPPVDFQTLGSIADRMREERLHEGQALLNDLSEEAKNNFGITPTLLLVEGSPGDKIVETAMADPNIIILVLSISHQQQAGLGKLASWLAGQLGVTLFVPLLMVPGNLTDQQLSQLV